MASLFSNNIVMLDSIDSTNNYLLNLIETKKAREGMVVVASHQGKGKGQRGKSWESNCGENLLVRQDHLKLILTKGYL